MYEGSARTGTGLTDTDALVAALSRQLVSLDSSSSRLTLARALVTAALQGRFWSGVAAEAYGFAVQSMDQQLAVAAMRLDDAIVETRRAIATLGAEP